MAVRQINVFELNPGGFAPLVEALFATRARVERHGIKVRLGRSSAGSGVGRIVSAGTVESWDAFAEYQEAIADGFMSLPIVEALISDDPPATVVNTVIQSEVGEGGSAGDFGFTSSLQFDINDNIAEVTAAIVETRDVFASLGAPGRVWVVANGENIGRTAISTEFGSVADWARFRGKLAEHMASNELPVNAHADSFTIAGLRQTTAIDQ